MRLLLVLLILLTFLLINLGGHVHNTHSSLACPDWPLCFGRFMPVMKKGVLIEHSHRLLASLVGLLTLFMAFLTRQHPLKKVALTALFMVIIQGVLGGVTVIFKLPPLISTAHLGLAMIYFCTLIYFHHKLNPTPKSSQSFFLTIWALGVLYIQILVGAFIRHIGAGTVCGLGDEYRVLCRGNWFPTTLLEFYHLGHRSLGIIAAINIIIVAFHQLKNNRPLSALLIFFLTLGQIWLGTEIIATGMRPLFTLLHLCFAALLLAVTFKIFLNQKASKELS